MPAEWEPHAATWLSWPHDPVTFPDRVDKAEDVYRQIIRALAPRERVNLLVKDEATHERVLDWAADENLNNLVIWDEPPADVWFRDYGPTFVRRGSGPGEGTERAAARAGAGVGGTGLSGGDRMPGPGAGPVGRDRDRGDLAMVKWRFNAWGNKYDTLLADDEIPYKLQPHLGLPMFEAGIVMEGGSLDVNGAGTLLTTEQCLLHKNRNPDLTKADIERRLADFLGVRHFLWLGDGIEADDTDGHVDDIARFVDASTVVAAVEDDPKDANHAPLATNLERLKRMTDQDGRPLTVVELPMPGRVADDEGRLPASYANFYIANGVVLLPIFGAKNDARATEIVRKCFPTRRVVPIRCEDLVFGMGTLHCITQQQPLA